MRHLPKLPAHARISVQNGARAVKDEHGKTVVDKVQCGTCGRVWNDALISARTPTPAGRCPYEAWHRA